MRVRSAAAGSFLGLVLAGFTGSPAASAAATITVNSTADTQSNDGKCTMREAIVAANTDTASGGAAGECAAGSGTDVIHFAIPGGDSGCNGSGVCTITTGGMPQLTTPMTIDGYTQSGASVNTASVGSNAHLRVVLTSTGGGTALFIDTPGVTIRGLVINGFSRGVETFDFATDGATVAGCFIGTDASGLVAAINTRGFNVSGSNWQIGGTALADRNVVMANDIAILLNKSDDGFVQGNLVGVKANGTERFVVANAGIGIQIVQNVGATLIGGAAAGAGNLVGGFGTGVFVNNSLSGTVTLQGNRIGTDAAGTLDFENGQGLLANASSMVVGGVAAGQGNVIAFSRQAGVLVGESTNSLIGITIRGNSIHDNARNVTFPGSDLGIDLVVADVSGSHNGVTANDPLDADDGNNGLQNYPLVNTVTATHIQGTLNSEANKTYTVDFYANTACSPSGFGEGETWLGSTPVTTNGGGDGSFNFAVSVPAGKKITATATAPDGSTSEFSRCADLLPRFLDADPTAGASSDGNGVFEPGESALVRPNWENPTGLDIAATSTASALTGPAGATYTTVDSTNDYGTLFKNSVGSCSFTSNCFGMFVSDPATRPAAHWDANFVETMSTREGAKAWKLHLGDSFSDVPRGYLFYKKIETVFHYGITVGCTATTYCPDDAVSRDQMAIFIARAIAKGGANVPASGTVDGHPYNCVTGGVSLFTDVPPGSIACKSIHYIASKNVTSGCNPGLYCPSGLVTRSQMAIFVAKGMVAPAGGAGIPLTFTDSAPPHLSYSCDAGGTPHSFFVDVTPADSFCKHVNFLAIRDIIAGCFSGHYCPDSNVTRGEMAKFLSNAFGLQLYGP